MSGTILDKIIADKKVEVAERRRRTPESELRARLKDAPPVRDFAAALAGEGISLIAEVKKASPSAGVIRKDFDSVAIAKIYESSGASAISVLTDEKYFQGRLGYLLQIKRAVGIPCLRKDFIIDEYQITEARAFGADAILLIVGVLDDAELRGFLGMAHGLGMSCLVESHSEEELKRALAAGAKIIGINNRDLRTFRTDLQTTINLMPLIPDDRIVVSESGIGTRDDVKRLEEAGVSAILVGETLMRSSDIPAAVSELLGKGESK